MEFAPLATVGVTAPSPVARITRGSPAFAGRLISPGIDPVGAAIVPSGFTAMALPAALDAVVKIAGERGPIWTDWTLETNCPWLTITVASPVLIPSGKTFHGTCTLICPGPTKNNAAGMPFMMTETFARLVDNGTESACASVAAKSLPNTDAIEPGATGTPGA